jgi:2-polyprenyl-3-methyl-5-hydroxy-6-metoxy-1,4-benzoquinol methylase
MIRRIKQSIRWRMGMPVAAPELEEGSDESIAKFYSDRVTHCEFLDDPAHYEYPRAEWVLSKVSGGNVLEIGAGNGGMTRLLAPKAGHLTAFDVSAPSLKMIDEMDLPNVETVCGLVESFSPGKKFDCIVISEVIEHLREPQATINTAFEWLTGGGRMVVTTPNGHWESDEHLHEFSLATFTAMLASTNCESFEAAYLRDRDNRRRWLTAVVTSGESIAAADDFFDRSATARKRRQKR